MLSILEIVSPKAWDIEGDLRESEQWSYGGHNVFLSDIMDIKSQEIYEFCRDLIQKGPSGVDVKAFEKMLDDAVFELAQDTETAVKE